MSSVVPTSITPIAMYQMSSEEIETLLDGIRERRLSSVRAYEAAVKASAEAADEKSRMDLMKQCEMLVKNIERVDKAIDALETRVTKVRVLRMDLGLD
jgi:hypothetical protein